MAVTKQTFSEWKLDPVTQAMFDDVAKAATGIIQQLTTRTESNVSLDQYQRGMLRGIQAGMEWEPVLEEEENAED